VGDVPVRGQEEREHGVAAVPGAGLRVLGREVGPVVGVGAEAVFDVRLVLPGGDFALGVVNGSVVELGVPVSQEQDAQESLPGSLLLGGGLPGEDAEGVSVLFLRWRILHWGVGLQEAAVAPAGQGRADELSDCGDAPEG